MKSLRIFAPFVIFVLMFLTTGLAFAQVSTQPCQPRIKLNNFPIDRQVQIQELLERTFCEMRDKLLARGLTKFPGKRGEDVLKFLDGREKVTIVWDKNFVYGKKAVPTFFKVRRGSILTGQRRSIIVGPLTFDNADVIFTVDRGGSATTYSENPSNNLRHYFLWGLTWLTSLGITEDGVYEDAAEYYYPRQRRVVEKDEK